MMLSELASSAWQVELHSIGSVKFALEHPCEFADYL
jgi:hypothetical protein